MWLVLGVSACGPHSLCEKTAPKNVQDCCEAKHKNRREENFAPTLRPRPNNSRTTANRANNQAKRQQRGKQPTKQREAAFTRFSCSRPSFHFAMFIPATHWGEGYYGFVTKPEYMWEAVEGVFDLTKYLFLISINSRCDLVVFACPFVCMSANISVTIKARTTKFGDNMWFFCTQKKTI